MLVRHQRCKQQHGQQNRKRTKRKKTERKAQHGSKDMALWRDTARMVHNAAWRKTVALCKPEAQGGVQATDVGLQRRGGLSYGKI